MLVAGDQRKPLDAKPLRRVALATSSDLIAIYVDAHRHGYPVLFDLILIGRGEARVHAGLSLWMARGGTLCFVRDAARGRCVRVTAAGLVEAFEPPFRNVVERITGIVRGQSLLTDRLWFNGGF